MSAAAFALALALALVPGAAAAQPVVHVAWEGPPGEGHAKWAPAGECWSKRGLPGDHVEHVAGALVFSDDATEAACISYTQPLPPLGGARHHALSFDADVAGADLAVRIFDRSGTLAATDVGAADGTRHFRLEAPLAGTALEPRIEWTYLDPSQDGTDATKAVVHALRAQVSGGPAYMMEGHEMTQSWLGAQLVVEHLWRFEVPAGPPGWEPSVELEIPQEFIVKGLEGRDVTTLHATEGQSRTMVEAVAGDQVIVRTLAPRLPADGGALALLFVASVTAVTVTGLAALRQLWRLHIRRNAGLVPWTILAGTLAVDAVSLMRVFDGGTWRLMVQTPMHPVGILLYGGFALLVLLNAGLLLAFARIQHRRISAWLDQRTQETQHLRRVNQALDEFAAGLAHDIKGPLGGARVALELVLDDHDALPPQQRQLLSEAQRSIAGLQRMAHQMLDLGELERSHEPEVVVDLHEVLEEARTILQPALSRNHARFELEVLPLVRGRRIQLVRLLQNLIENTIKHARSDDPCIRIRATPLGPRHRITFSDNGRGLSPGTGDAIFQASHRGPGDGYGLGLALVRRIVELHGGEIHVSSEPGHGTMFSFTLPAVQHEPPTRPDVPSEAPHPSARPA